MVIRDAAWGTICGNNIIDNGSYNPGGVNFKLNFEDLEEEMPLMNGICLSKVRGFNISNNTIFNWELAPKMRYGIHEDGSCFKNVIEGNNINYYLEADVLSEGEQTTVGNNVGLADDTYFEIHEFSSRQSIKGHFRQGTIQSYQPELMQQFINSLK
jgi:hypothetical protein